LYFSVLTVIFLLFYSGQFKIGFCGLSGNCEINGDDDVIHMSIVIPPRRLCIQRRLFVCQHGYAKTTQPNSQNSSE